MDNYPEHLAPRFEAGGGVEEPFDEWWPKVRAHFPHVPEDVARYWLHEHWNHSPYYYLRSRAYHFELLEWPAERLLEMRSTWAEYSENNTPCVSKGEYLCNSREFGERYYTATYMLENR